MSFCYMQLQTANHGRANKFYKEMFGWKLDASNPHYTEADTGGPLQAGIMPAAAPGQPSSWLPYVAVEDLDDTLDHARQLDAQILVTPTDVPGKGRYAVVLDPTGAAIGLWQVGQPSA